MAPNGRQTRLSRTTRSSARRANPAAAQRNRCSEWRVPPSPRTEPFAAATAGPRQTIRLRKPARAMRTRARPRNARAMSVNLSARYAATERRDVDRERCIARQQIVRAMSGSGNSRSSLESRTFVACRMVEPRSDSAAAGDRVPSCRAGSASQHSRAHAHDGIVAEASPYIRCMSLASMLALDHHFLDLGDRLGRIEVLRAGLGAVHDGVAAIQPERIFQLIEPLAGGLVAACR